MPDSFPIETRVRSIRWEAEDVCSIELEPVRCRTLPPFDAGAHIEVQLTPSIVRSYSLIGSPSDRERYVIAVARDARSRGGSRFIHDELRPGRHMFISEPHNHFRFDESGRRSVFIAGGIGITPIWAMIRRAVELRADWELYYCVRSESRAAFVEELEALAGEGRNLRFHFDDEHGGAFLDIASVVATIEAEAHLYCCGPPPMLDAFEAACATRPSETVHLEYFEAKTLSHAPIGGFELVLGRSGRSIEVPPGVTILDALIAAGMEPPYSCREGVCGTCETPVIEGVPDHRDSVLTEAERASNRSIMICCSGSKSPRLMIDL